MNKLSFKIKQVFYYLFLTAIAIKKVTNAYAPISNPAVPKWGSSDQPGLYEGGPFILYAVLMWQAVTAIGALIVIAYYILGALDWLTSGDKTEGVEKARNRIMHATVGLILLVSSFTLVGWIGKILFGDTFNILNLSLPSNI